MNVNLTPLQLVLIAIVIMFLCLLLKHLVEADTSEPPSPSLSPSPPSSSPSPSPPSPTCENVLKEYCTKIEPIYGTGEEGCRKCAANHQSDVRDAGCTADKINNWCEESFPPPPPPPHYPMSEQECIDHDWTRGSAPWNYCMKNYPLLDPNNCLTLDFETKDPNGTIFGYCMKRYPRAICKNPHVDFDDCTKNPDSFDKIASYCGNNPNANPDQCDETDLDGLPRRMYYCYNKKATLKDCKNDKFDYLDVYCEYSKNAKPNECTAPNAKEDYCKNKIVTKDTKFCNSSTA